MPTYIPISPTNLAGKYWRRFTTLAHAAADPVVPLVLKELPKVQCVMPIAFSLHNDHYVPVAVQGFAPGQNIFVDNEVKWLGDYIPAHYRGYPFSLVQSQEDKRILCIDEDSGLISDTDGEPFFDDAGQPSQSIKDILEFHLQIVRNRQQTQRLCDQLHQHQIIEPWPLTINTPDGDKALQGLHRICGAALNECDPAVLHQLQSSGALTLAYCQMLSMQNLDKLKKLASLHATKKEQTAKPDIEKLFGDSGSDMFKF